MLNLLLTHIKNLSQLKFGRLAIAIALIILGLDCLFVTFHLYLAYFYDLSDFQAFSLEFDGGYPEQFQYVKELSIVGCLLVFSIYTKKKTILCWCALFLFIYADDAFSFHETLALGSEGFFEGILGFVPHATVRELIVWGGFGGIFTISLAIAYVKSQGYIRHIHCVLFVLFGMIVFFGVVVDAAHMLAIGMRFLSAFLAVLEDGGEHFAVSLTLIYSVVLLQNSSHIMSLDQKEIN